jgi:hypothetical protein
VRGAKVGPPRSPLHASPRRQRPPARTLRAHRRHGAAAVPASARARRGQSDGMLSASPHNEARPVSTTTAAPTGERSVSGPRFPIGLRGAATAYAANTSVNTTMRRVPPSRHVLVARDPSTSAGDESSLGSLDALPPATSHGYAEWDFSGVPDSVMFRRFLDTTDYWFGYSDDSSAGSYDPARECLSLSPTTQRTPPVQRAPATGNFFPPWGPGRAWPRGQAPLLPHHRGGPILTRSWPKHVSSRPSWRKSTTPCVIGLGTLPGRLRSA